MKGTTLQVDRKSRPHRIVLAHLQGNAVSIGHRRGDLDRFLYFSGNFNYESIFVINGSQFKTSEI
jgi:hypothetical protein